MRRRDARVRGKRADVDVRSLVEGRARRLRLQLRRLVSSKRPAAPTPHRTERSPFRGAWRPPCAQGSRLRRRQPNAVLPLRHFFCGARVQPRDAHLHCGATFAAAAAGAAAVTARRGTGLVGVPRLLLQRSRWLRLLVRLLVSAAAAERGLRCAAPARTDTWRAPRCAASRAQGPRLRYLRGCALLPRRDELRGAHVQP